MAWWLLNILPRGEPGRSYNLDSPQAITLKELAEKISHLLSDKIEINHSRALLKSKTSILYQALFQIKYLLFLEHAHLRIFQ